jgi:hypothetical protein
MNEIITRIVTNRYGHNAMARGLADDLIAKMPDWNALDGDERERQIMLTCWNWFSGGSTAEVVAHQIKMRLFGAGEWTV